MSRQFPPKYRELIGLAVAAQIPCDYCVYAHTTKAEMAGATTEEIDDALGSGLNQAQKAMMAASATAERKLRASLS